MQLQKLEEPQMLASRRTFRARHGLLILVLLVTLFFGQWIPHDFSSFILNDSGIFLYAAQQMNAGAGLYTGVWDHKPPVIFYLNQFGLALFHGSPAGVWILSYLFFLGFVLITWRILHHHFSSYPALLASLLVLFTVPLLIGTPNIIENYAILFQSLGLYLYMEEAGIDVAERSLLFVLPALQGLLAVLLFQLRPNLIGMPAAYVLMSSATSLWKRDWGGAILRLLVFGGACIVGTAAFLWRFWAEGSIAQYLDGVIGFNLAYSSAGSSLPARVRVLYDGFSLTSHAGIGLLAGLALLTLVLSRGFWTKSQFQVARFAALLLILECLLSSVSGKSFEHYFELWLLPMAVLSAGLIEQLLFVREPYSAIVPVACCVLALKIALDSGAAIRTNIAKDVYPTRHAVTFLQHATTPNDKVLVWGSRYREVWFRLGRKPISRFFSTTPMTHDKELYRRLAPEVLHSLDVTSPPFIVEIQQPNLPCLFAEMCDSRTSAPWDDTATQGLKRTISHRYSLVFEDPGPGHISVYRLNPTHGKAAGLP